MNREEQIQSIVESLVRLQRPSIHSSSAWKEIGLSHAQVGMLFLLSHRQENSVKETADYLGISKSAVSQLADPLVEKALIARVNDLKDRRIVRLQLTEKGRQLMRRLARRKLDSFRSAIGKLSDNEVEHLHKLIIKMSQN